jgi:hypothetical protein
MTATPWIAYGHAVEQIWKGGIDVENDSFRMVLVGSGYTPNQLTDDAWSDVSANEIANGNGYATHGKAVDLAVTRAGLVIKVDTADQTWADSTFTVKYAVIVRDADGNGALAAGDIPLCYCQLLTEAPQTLSPSNGPLTVTIDADGVMGETIAAAP